MVTVLVSAGSICPNAPQCVRIAGELVNRLQPAEEVALPGEAEG
jgi:hypothetical protein